MHAAADPPLPVSSALATPEKKPLGRLPASPAKAQDPTRLLTLILCSAILLALVLPDGSPLPQPYRFIGQVTGYTYTLAWGLSFYPQLLSNWRRKSTVGFSPDFAILNPAGFFCLSVYYGALYASPLIQREYSEHFSGHTNAVRLNDVIFALNGAITSSFTLAQCFIYDSGTQRVSTPTRRAFWVLGPFTLGYGLAVWLLPQTFTHLWFLSWLALIKLLVTLTKYVPQVLLNAARQSTKGFSIFQIILDITGGVMSVFQLCLEAVVLQDVTLLTGDSIKLGLGLVSVGYDLVLLYQHYVLYANADPRHLKAEGEGAGAGAAMLPVRTPSNDREAAARG